MFLKFKKKIKQVSTFVHYIIMFCLFWNISSDIQYDLNFTDFAAEVVKLTFYHDYELEIFSNLNTKQLRQYFWNKICVSQTSITKSLTAPIIMHKKVKVGGFIGLFCFTKMFYTQNVLAHRKSFKHDGQSQKV